MGQFHNLDIGSDFMFAVLLLLQVEKQTPSQRSGPAGANLLPRSHDGALA